MPRDIERDMEPVYEAGRPRDSQISLLRGEAEHAHIQARHITDLLIDHGSTPELNETFRDIRMQLTGITEELEALIEQIKSKKDAQEDQK